MLRRYRRGGVERIPLGKALHVSQRAIQRGHRDGLAGLL